MSGRDRSAELFSSTTPSAAGRDRSAELFPKAAEAQPPSNPGFFESFGGKINPVKMLQGMSEMVQHPIDTLAAIGSAQDQLRLDAKKAFESKDYWTAVRKAAEWMVPVLGPEMSHAGDRAANGEIAGALGEAAGIGTNLVIGAKAPGAVAAIPKKFAGTIQAAREVMQSPGIGQIAGGAAEAASGIGLLAHGDIASGAIVGGRGLLDINKGLATRAAARNVPPPVVKPSAPVAAIEGNTGYATAARGPVQPPTFAPPQSAYMGEMRSTSGPLPQPAPPVAPLPIPQGTTTAQLPRGPMAAPTGTVPANPAALLNQPTVAPQVLDFVAVEKTGKPFAAATPTQQAAIQATAESMGDMYGDLAESVKRVKAGKSANSSDFMEGKELKKDVQVRHEARTEEAQRVAIEQARIGRGNAIAAHAISKWPTLRAEHLQQFVERPDAQVWEMLVNQANTSLKAAGKRANVTLPTSTEGRQAIVDALRRYFEGTPQ